MRKPIAALALTGLLALFVSAQAQKNWKDRAEYDLYEAITKPDATPAARLQNLDKWKSGYAQSEYADVRLKIYLVTYQALNNHRAAFDTATEILKAEPNDMSALTEHIGYIRSLVPAGNAPLTAQQKSDLETAEKTARYVLANLDTIYAADKKPQGTTDAQWTSARPSMQKFAQFTLGWIGTTQKDTAKAEAELVKTLQMDPTNAQASYMLAGVLLSQQKDHPDKMPFAIFEYARSAVYDGMGAMDAATRKQVDAFFVKAYNTFHGSAEGIEKVRELAKTNALPPSGFDIESIVKISERKAAQEAADAAANPMLALFNSIKTQLQSDGGPAYWESSAKDAALPGGAGGVTKFKGKLISATPETNPKELTLAVGGEAADITIKLDEPLRGKMEPGGEISFSGTAKEYTKEPFMLTFEVEPANIDGWTGKGAAPARAPGAGKKGAPAAPKKK